mgnify:CR=1 FL=1
MEQDDLILDRINHLPSLPPVLARITEVVSHPEASVNTIVEALKLDPGICSKVLRLANSAYVGIPRTVSSLHNAVVILGQRRIQSLVLAAHTLAAFGCTTAALPFSGVAFWRHSVTVAIICESIARHLKRYDAVEAGELFCSGILHDVGKLALAVFDPGRIEQTAREAKGKAEPFFSVEDHALSHFTVGALLAQRWNFPPDLRNAILYHHDPANAEPFTRMAGIVHLADVMAHIIGHTTFEDEVSPPIDERAITDIELQPERLRVIAITAIEDEKRLESLIEFIR